MKEFCANVYVEQKTRQSAAGLLHAAPKKQK